MTESRTVCTCLVSRSLEPGSCKGSITVTMYKVNSQCLCKRFPADKTTPRCFFLVPWHSGIGAKAISVFSSVSYKNPFRGYTHLKEPIIVTNYDLCFFDKFQQVWSLVEYLSSWFCDSKHCKNTLSWPKDRRINDVAWISSSGDYSFYQYEANSKSPGFYRFLHLNLFSSLKINKSATASSVIAWSNLMSALEDILHLHRGIRQALKYSCSCGIPRY